MDEWFRLGLQAGLLLMAIWPSIHLKQPCFIRNHSGNLLPWKEPMLLRFSKKISRTSFKYIPEKIYQHSSIPEKCEAVLHSPRSVCCCCCCFCFSLHRHMCCTVKTINKTWVLVQNKFWISYLKSIAFILISLAINIIDTPRQYLVYI